MPTLQEIEGLASAYATAINEAADAVHELEALVTRLKRRRLGRLRQRAARAADAKAALIAAIDASKGLFERPKTRVFHGIKIGFRKQPGALTWEDEQKVIARIKQHCADQIDVLIKTTEKPVRGALAQVPADMLKRLGITVVSTADTVVVESAVGDIEKLVNTLIGDVNEALEAEREEAA